MGRFQEALESYDNCLGMNPGVSVVYSNRGVALAAIGRGEDALSSFRTALDLDPGDLIALNNIGILLSRMGRDEEAMAYLDRAREQARNRDILRRVW